ncbi:thioesterase family protein [Actinokineospora iranica]|uniref:Thioesterase-like superfamily protein n=1 Tax=Actinokineospora iranica TaxID=1271860 RepID=A0A1G6IZJ1_9PSEU|nr:thioesterase family protein [Actinokineospora iranica]SDC11206.1 Thioesterase-like superfamily protein [Actinokineospora iranica]
MAFYEPLGEGRYASTRHTAGPWTADSQHMGPPTALLARELAALPAAAPSALARVTVEILGPVPVAELSVSAEVERPGRSVELARGEIRAGGRAVARASAWRIVTSDTSAVRTPDDVAPLAPPAAGTPITRPDNWGPGYLDVMEWRALTGSLDKPGPATVWVRQTIPLVAGEEPTPLQRLLVVADSGSGASGLLDPRKWWFINTELTVHVIREPEGEWIGLDAHSVIGPNGTGTALSVLHDTHGAVARGAQALFVRER